MDDGLHSKLQRYDILCGCSGIWNGTCHLYYLIAASTGHSTRPKRFCAVGVRSKRLLIRCITNKPGVTATSCISLAEALTASPMHLFSGPRLDLDPRKGSQSSGAKEGLLNLHGKCRLHILARPQPSTKAIAVCAKLRAKAPRR